MKEIIVSKQNKGHYTKVQEAIDNIIEQGLSNVTLRIQEGCYEEVVKIPAGIKRLKIKGDGFDKTKITYGNYAGILLDTGEKLGTNRSSSVFIDADDVMIEGISFENSYEMKEFDGPGRQAVALNTTGKNLVFRHCGFYGNQDTLYVREGSCVFTDCYIEGDIDFIFGAAQAVFYHCDIHSKDCGSKELNGYTTAASTRAADCYGFLFYQCKFSAQEGISEHSVYLGRPWHPSSATDPVCSSTLLIACELGSHIKEEGWTYMGKVWPDTERLYEYQSRGEGAFIHTKRKQLTKEEANKAVAFIISRINN